MLIIDNELSFNLEVIMVELQKTLFRAMVLITVLALVAFLVSLF